MSKVSSDHMKKCIAAVQEAAKTADVVVQGSSCVGAQEHFYLETNATVALPTEHGHLEIIASTQNLSKTQAEVAAVTGLPMGQVVCKAKRHQVVVDRLGDLEVSMSKANPLSFNLVGNPHVCSR